MSPTAPLVSTFLALAVLGACSQGDADGGTAAGSSPEDVVVTMERSRYEPQQVEVPAGTEVTFENVDPFAHTVTSADGSPTAFDSGELRQDATFVHVFDEPGTHEYFCQIHPTMRAEVVVT